MLLLNMGMYNILLWLYNVTTSLDHNCPLKIPPIALPAAVMW